MDTNNRAIWLTPVLILAMAAGCTVAPPKPASRPAGPEEDPCAERLHDLSGQLLMYYVRHNKLPQDLSQLGSESPKPVCPVCNKPYLYNPQGLDVPNMSARAIVWDALPCHSGFRWAIVMDLLKPGQSLNLKVIPLPKDPVPPSP